MLIHWGLPGLVVHWASVAPVDHFEARSLGVSNVGNPASPRRPQKGANALVESRPNSTPPSDDLILLIFEIALKIPHRSPKYPK